MRNRREFLKKSLITCATVATLPNCTNTTVEASQADLKTRQPKKALVLWYSQTGHTKQYGETIAHTLKKAQVSVDSVDIREFDTELIDQYDLIVAGTPVHYYSVPKNYQKWLQSLKRIDGTAIATYSTFGGHGDNPWNTACTLAELLIEKGGLPVGIDMFGNMSTFAPTWSMGNEERILKYRHLPDEDTYQSVSQFADQVLETLKAGTIITPEKVFATAELMKVLPTVWGTKLLIGQHTINSKNCIRCNTCMEKCPVGAIDVASFSVNRDICIACMGCVNNCPVGALEMTFMGHKVVGFFEFMRNNGIKRLKPEFS